MEHGLASPAHLPEPEIDADDPADDPTRRLDAVLGALRLAKECLPGMNNTAVPADQVARASELVDRMHALAMALAASARSPGAAEDGHGRRHAA
jgi:hypothetical protein